MRRRDFNIFCLVSVVYLTATIGSWAWSYYTDPRKQYVSFGSGFHVAVWDGHIWFFNDKSYGPYRGSVIALSGRNSASPFAEEWYFGYQYGIYYRYFRWAKSGAVLWTLAVSLFYPLFLYAILPAVWLWQTWRNWRVARRLVPPEEAHGPRQQMQLAIRLYWWMGVLGSATYLLVSLAICLTTDWNAALERKGAIAGLIGCWIFVAIFAYSIRMAKRLSTRPHGMLRRARLLAIVLATAWLPLLTVPGIICFRRVTENLDAYCALLSKEREER